jgi:hypothetical protein
LDRRSLFEKSDVKTFKKTSPWRTAKLQFEALSKQYYDILSRVEIPPYTDSSALDHITNIVTDISKDGIDLDTSIRRREEELIKFLTE